MTAKTFGRLGLCALAIFSRATVVQAAEYVLYFQSQPGDYIGQGERVLLRPADVDFRLAPASGNAALSFSIDNQTRPVPPSDVIWWHADFAAPFGNRLVVGTYLNATRFPFQGANVPGLSFYGNGRGCNMLTGRFDVLEAVYDVVTNVIQKFAVDFEQHCEGGTPALFGQLRFDSDVPLRHGEDVLINFGPSYGVWALYPGPVFQQLHARPPAHMATADLDGNGRDDAVFDFPGFGIWILFNGTSWAQLHPWSVSIMRTGDIDGSGRADLVLDFPGAGLWAWLNNSSWVRLIDIDARHLVVADLNGNGRADLVADFNGVGVWVNYGSGWTQMHPSNVSLLAAGDLDGSGYADVLFEFPGHGVWLWLDNTAWIPVHGFDAVRLETADVDGNGLEDLVVEFAGFGIWAWELGGTWRLLHFAQSEGFVSADLDGNRRDELVVDFGASGLWVWTNGTWIQVHGFNPEALATGELDGR